MGSDFAQAEAGGEDWPTGSQQVVHRVFGVRAQPPTPRWWKQGWWGPCAALLKPRPVPSSVLVELPDDMPGTHFAGISDHPYYFMEPTSTKTYSLLI